MRKLRNFALATAILIVALMFTSVLFVRGDWRSRLSSLGGRQSLQVDVVERLSSSAQQNEETTVPEAVTPEPQTSPTPLPTEAFPSPVPYIPAPLPAFTNTPDSKLIPVQLTNLRLLSLPIEQHSAFAALTWSPDSKQFMGLLIGDESIQIGNEGRSIINLYLGNVETGDVQLWQTNGTVPSWSRDGRTVYYLSIRTDDKTWIYDLYRRNLEDEQPELIRANVGAPNLIQPSAVESISGDLIFLDTKLHPVRQTMNNVDANSVPPELQPLLDLVVGDTTALADQEVQFSVSHDGRFVALLSSQPHIYLIDLKAGKQIAVLDNAAYYSSNVAWSTDSQLFAYATPEGVYVYNLATAETFTLVTRQDLGFNREEMSSGFGMPYWFSNNEIVEFTAVSPDWNFQLPSEEQRPHSLALAFAATQNGSVRELISEYMIEAMSLDGTHAIVRGWNDKLQQYEKYIADIIWN